MNNEDFLFNDALLFRIRVIYLKIYMKIDKLKSLYNSSVTKLENLIHRHMEIQL
jgi:hypothetical protein